MDDTLRLRNLIDRLARLNAAEAWSAGLNPGQAAALAYLAQANRFSRAPSNVADYLASTRGTVSQTLKALTRKGFIAEVRSEQDRRSIRYDVTDAGLEQLKGLRQFDTAIARLAAGQPETLNAALSDLLRAVLDDRGLRSFGMCRTCTHHEIRGKGGYCHLLKVDLQPAEVEQLCHEHQA